jgi:hypothetical protein
MPMLSPRGFVDITVIEIVGEPNRGTLMLNRVWKHYGVWKERGEIPIDSVLIFSFAGSVLVYGREQLLL